jgi:uncharacterized UBP type Zn finger protein
MARRVRPVAGNGSAPRCDHIDALVRFQPASAVCQECQAAGDIWVELWRCLSCGWIACSDSSPNHHAMAHYEETDHPVVAAFEPASSWRWCYVHQRIV